MIVPPSFVISVSLIFSFTSAAPTSSKRPESTISEALLSKFELYEQYAAASYCPRNFEANPEKKLKCPVGNCPRVETADTSVIYSFTSTPLTDTSGYVAVDFTNSLIIVAFRGSESFRNYLTFLDFPLIPIDICAGCLGGKGYWNGWREVRDEVLDAVRRTHEEYPGFKVVVTGHSLGGAIATFAAAEVRDAGHVVDLSTFGAPRIGNSLLVDYITAQTFNRGQNYRIGHTGDPTPSVPLTSIGYRHLSPEYLITSNNADTPTVEDVIRRENDEETEGLIGTNLIEANKAHDFYFGEISICFDGGILIPW